MAVLRRRNGPDRRPTGRGQHPLTWDIDGDRAVELTPTHPALEAAAARLRCPRCGAPLAYAEDALKCARGHSYDIARHGHVSLLALDPQRHVGDSAEMAAARASFLGAGHYAPIADAIAAAAGEVLGAPSGRSGCIVDFGAGTGYYLAALLQQLPGWLGIALDASRPALRRAVRANPRIAAIACDAWQPIPLRDGAADLIINVFAPRNGPEIARVMSSQGALIIVTPTERHLQELARPVGLLGVDPDKQARLRGKLSRYVRAVRRCEVEFELVLAREDGRALVAMGPSAYHLSHDELARRLSFTPGELRATASVVIDTFRRA